MNESVVTFLFELGNFVLLAAVLAWLFFKPVRAAIERQRQKVQGEIDAAATERADANQMRTEAERQTAELRTELQRLRATAVESAQREADALLAEARKQLEYERTALQHDVLNLQRTQTSKIATIVAEVSRESVRRLLSQIHGPELETALVDAACRELSTLNGKNLLPVTVESSSPLSEEIRGQIATAVGYADHAVDFRIEPELVCGIRISTAHGLVDASVTGLADFAEQNLIARLQERLAEEASDA